MDPHVSTFSLELHNLILMMIAIANAAGAYYAYRTKIFMRKLEENTNGIKDALVKATGESSFAAGEKKAREAGEAKAEALLNKDKKP